MPKMVGVPGRPEVIPIPADWLGGIATGANSVWIGRERADVQIAHAVVRVDPETNEVVATIEVAATPSREQIAASDEAVWVGGRGILQRIDPVTDAIAAEVPLPGRDVSALALDGSAVWAVTVGDDGGELVRIDGATNRIAGRIPLGDEITGYGDQVVVAFGSVWVLGVRWEEKGNTEYGSDLIRVDPPFTAISARIPIGAFSMTPVEGEMWVRFPRDGAFDGKTHGAKEEQWRLSKVEAGTSEVSAPFRFDGWVDLVTPGHLWDITYDDNEAVVLRRYNSASLRLEASSDPLQSYFTDSTINPQDGTAWISGTVGLIRIDIR